MSDRARARQATFIGVVLFGAIVETIKALLRVAEMVFWLAVAALIVWLLVMLLVAFA